MLRPESSRFAVAWPSLVGFHCDSQSAEVHFSGAKKSDHRQDRRSQGPRLTLLIKASAVVEGQYLEEFTNSLVGNKAEHEYRIGRLDA